MNETPEMLAALEVKGLVAGYDGREVLHGVDVIVMPGQTFGVVGLNGVGKTTMIKCILALKEVGGGGIRIFGRSHGEGDSRAHIAYLPERFDPPWFLTGGEFIEFSASLYGRKIGIEDMSSACESVALDADVLSRRVQTYSKGMRQKLGLIATVLTGCQMLILDEPMSGLDPRARALVKKLLGQVRAEGRTVVLSSHILSDMDEICDQIAVIDGGHVRFSGAPRGLRQEMEEETLEKAFLKVIDKAA
jgi:ABC-2 type transport system ATP-binding protein